MGQWGYFIEFMKLSIFLKIFQLKRNDYMQENIIQDHQKKSDKIKKTILGSEKGWKLTFDAIPDLVTILDTDHRVVKVNKAMAERLITSPNHVLESYVIKLFTTLKPHQKIVHTKCS